MNWSALVLGCVCAASIGAEPARQIPKELRAEFTLDGRIPVAEWYWDSSYSSEEPRFYTKTVIDECIGRIQRGETNQYGPTDTWLYEALKIHPIEGKTVAIIGSVEPWYESVVLAYGGKPITIEYNQITTDDSRLTILTAEEYNKKPFKVDVVLSISSTEHDGLGRYGDPINPSGDLEFMSMVKRVMLKDSGMLILAVPVGRDCLTWNAHRIYGVLRLPMLLQGWRVVDLFGWIPEAFSLPLTYFSYQPVLCLKPDESSD
jgi:hypothetical protein